MSREIFYFDTKTFRYVRQRRNLFYFVRHYGWLLIISALVITVTAYYFIAYNPADITRQLRNENILLANKTAEYQQLSDSIEIWLHKLHQEDKALYRQILNSEDKEEDIAGRDSASQTDAAINNKAINNKDMEAWMNSLDDRLRQQARSHDALYNLARSNATLLQHIPSIRPVPTEIISGFGIRRHPITQKDKLNTGIDFRAEPGTPVRATADGIVLSAKNQDNGRGLGVVIDHQNGYRSMYTHLSKTTVISGQAVKRGDIIGYSGSSGLCKGPHLHYELHQQNKPIDPIDFFFFDLKPAEYLQFRKKAAVYNESMG